MNEAIELAFDLEEALGLGTRPPGGERVLAAAAGLAVATTTAARGPGVSLTAAQRSALVAIERVRRRTTGGAGRTARPTRRSTAARHGSMLPRLAGRPADHRPTSTTLADALMRRARRRAGRAVSDRASTGAFADLVADSSMIVTCGPGGVGKTTTAAAIGLIGARAGRRVVVVTIDPARRLADALGLVGGPPDEPHRVTGLGRLPGTLDVLMLDAERTFDRMIVDRAGARAEAILQNRIYRSIAGSLSGAQEYMAIERLHQLYEAGAARPDRGRHAAVATRGRHPVGARSADGLLRASGVSRAHDPRSLDGAGDVDRDDGVRLDREAPRRPTHRRGHDRVLPLDVGHRGRPAPARRRGVGAAATGRAPASCWCRARVPRRSTKRGT